MKVFSFSFWRMVQNATIYVGRFFVGWWSCGRQSWQKSWVQFPVLSQKWSIELAILVNVFGVRVLRSIMNKISAPMSACLHWQDSLNSRAKNKLPRTTLRPLDKWGIFMLETKIYLLTSSLAGSYSSSPCLKSYIRQTGVFLVLTSL